MNLRRADMPSHDTIDFSLISSPIAGENVAGPDLSRDFSPEAIYRQIKDARHRARRVERSQVWEDADNTETADWSPIIPLASDVLGTKSKDLRIAGWLTEALVRVRGFAGLNDGLRVCSQLVEHFWGTLHPNDDPNDDPNDSKIAVIEGLLGGEYEGTLLASVRRISLVEDIDHMTMGLSVYDQAEALENITDSNERTTRIEHGAATLEIFNQAVRASSSKFYINLLSDIEASRHQLDDLMASIDKACQQDKHTSVLRDRDGSKYAPSASEFREALESCHRRVKAILSEFFPGSDDNNGQRIGDNEESELASSESAGPIQTRAQAFDRIRQAAIFFRKTEPHSVLSWQLEECVRWGNMNLPDLLKELIHDDSARKNLFQRVGIPPHGDE